MTSSYKFVCQKIVHMHNFLVTRLFLNYFFKKKKMCKPEALSPCLPITTLISFVLSDRARSRETPSCSCFETPDFFALFIVIIWSTKVIFDYSISMSDFAIITHTSVANAIAFLVFSASWRFPRMEFPSAISPLSLRCWSNVHFSHCTG